jgi:hypothetical protein
MYRYMVVSLQREVGVKTKTKKALSAIRRAAVNKRWAKAGSRERASEATRAAYAALRQMKQKGIEQ